MNIGVAEANAWDAYTTVHRVHIEQGKGPDSASLATRNTVAPSAIRTRGFLSIISCQGLCLASGKVPMLSIRQSKLMVLPALY